MQISNCRNWKEDEILDLQKMNEKWNTNWIRKSCVWDEALFHDINSDTILKQSKLTEKKYIYKREKS
jgi:hypothetical protein